MARSRHRHARPQDRRRRAEGDARGVRGVPALPRHPEGHDLRLGPHPPGRPALRAGARLAAELAAAGWMVVTGAGPGIMAAAWRAPGASARSASRSGCRSSRAPTRHRRRRRSTSRMKYFFTRKLMLVKESQGLRLPARRVRHARRDVRAAHPDADRQGPAVPIVLLDAPGDPYWEAVAGVHRRPARHAAASSTQPTPSCSSSPTTATRRPGDHRLLRQLRLAALRRRPARHPRPPQRHRRRQLDELERTLRSPVHPRADRAQRAARRSRCASTTTVDLAADPLRFAKHGFGDLRQLIDTVNDFVEAD